MKATLFYSLAAADSDSSSRAIRLMRELLKEYGADAFELELICIDDNPNFYLPTELVSLPYLIILDGTRQAPPIVGELETHKELIKHSLGLSLRSTL